MYVCARIIPAAVYAITNSRPHLEIDGRGKILSSELVGKYRPEFGDEIPRPLQIRDLLRRCIRWPARFSRVSLVFQRVCILTDLPTPDKTPFYARARALPRRDFDPVTSLPLLDSFPGFRDIGKRKRYYSFQRSKDLGDSSG